MRDYKQLEVPRSVWEDPLHFIAFGFGSGAVPVAPGTFGTLMAVPFYLALRTFSNNVYFLLLILIAVGSIWLCDKVSRALNVHDHPGMCLDEIVGYLVTMFNAPRGIEWIVCGFLLFRVFDILKPWPIGYVDKHVKGGLGVVLDDILAGVYSLILLHIISWVV